MERKLTKGQLFYFDQQFSAKLRPDYIKTLIQNKLEEEIYLVKNVFKDNREYDFEATEEERGDEKYTRVKRLMKNPDALKKFNNLNLSEQIYLQYMLKSKNTEGMSNE